MRFGRDILKRQASEEGMEMKGGTSENNARGEHAQTPVSRGGNGTGCVHADTQFWRGVQTALRV
jgi:hypothetical protein